MKIFIFGVSGLVGSAVARSGIRRGLEVHGFYGERPSGVEGLRSERALSVVESEPIERVLLDEWPDVVINAAAISSPDQVDRDPALAEKVNVAFPRQLAMLTGHIGSKLLHFSTDMVFDGEVGGYRSTSIPNPSSLYGQLKLMAEKEVLKFNQDKPLVLRITIVNGNSVTGQRSVHEKLLSMVLRGEKPTLFEDEIRQPCSAENVAEVAIELSERTDLYGIFHWAGSDAVSRYEMGCRIMDRFGLDRSKLKKVRQQGKTDSSGRPSNLTMELEPLRGKLRTQPTSIAGQMEELKPPPHLYRWLREHGKL